MGCDSPRDLLLGLTAGWKGSNSAMTDCMGIGALDMLQIVWKNHFEFEEKVVCLDTDSDCLVSDPRLS